MCILCVEIAKQKMTVREVCSAFLEMSTINPEHYEELFNELAKYYDIDEVFRDDWNNEGAD